MSLGAEDESTFTMSLLHFRRTFVEKLFTIHGKIEQYLKDGKPLGTYARHYYDLYMLAQRAEVPAMLRSEEYEQLRLDYDRVSRTHFPKHYIPPEGMRFNQSAALFPTGELRTMVSGEYKRQCQLLCFGDHPSWEKIEECFSTLKDLI
nr:nucleotidyl transferase AbiEii/AbiGii toxin family protein [Singulisphaera acidiphila]